MSALHEQYRPTCWAEVFGQDAAVSQIQAVLKRGWGNKATFKLSARACVTDVTVSDQNASTPGCSEKINGLLRAYVHEGVRNTQLEPIA